MLIFNSVQCVIILKKYPPIAFNPTLRWSDILRTHRQRTWRFWIFNRIARDSKRFCGKFLEEFSQKEFFSCFSKIRLLSSNLSCRKLSLICRLNQNHFTQTLSEKYLELYKFIEYRIHTVIQIEKVSCACSSGSI